MVTNRQCVGYLLTPLLVVISYCGAISAMSPHIFSILLRLFNQFAQPVLFLWLCMGLLVLIFGLAREAIRPAKRSLGIYFADLFKTALRPSVQIICLIPPLTLALLFAGYSTFKQIVIPTSDYWAGPYLASVEYTMLFHHHAWEITHGILPVAAGYWLDQIYQLWFVLVVTSVLACSYLSGDPLHRCRFVLCFSSTWIITGTVLAYLIPASGPVYFGDFQTVTDPFLTLKAQLAADDLALRQSYGTGLQALKGQAMLLEQLKTHNIFPGGGISAMPSMHNAVSVLLACAAYSINRWFGWIMILFATLIFVGSVHLGWHYALDGVVAAAISIGIWLSSNRIIERYERRIARRRTRASGGRRRTDKQYIPEPISA